MADGDCGDGRRARRAGGDPAQGPAGEQSVETERLMLLAITRNSDPGPVEEDDAASEKETSGLFGIVSTVFNSESHSNSTAEKIVPLSPSYRCLFDSRREISMY